MSTALLPALLCPCLLLIQLTGTEKFSMPKILLNKIFIVDVLLDEKSVTQYNEQGWSGAAHFTS